MEHRQQAEELYRDIRCNGFEEDDKLPTVKEILKKFVCQCQPQQKFKFKELPSVIMRSAKETSFRAMKAGETFEKLEYYFSLVSLYPWKSEFHKIKKYSGFYQTKVASHLTGVEELFQLVGYNENLARNELNLNKNVDKNLLLVVAFECLIASAECFVLHEIESKTKFTINPLDIVTLRVQYSGGMDEIYSILRKTVNFKKDESVIESSMPLGSTKNDYVDQLSPVHMKTEITPFEDSDVKIDAHQSDLKEGTLDDHLMASLQLINEENSHVIAQPSVRPSEEWSFVQEGLRRKYGEKYFDGQRGNILTPSSKESRQPRDSGIGSGLPSEHPYAEVDTLNTRSGFNKDKIPHSVAHAQLSWQTQPELPPQQRSQYSWPQLDPQPNPIHKPQFSSPFPQQTTKTEILRSRNKSVPTYPTNLLKQTIKNANYGDIAGDIRPSGASTQPFVKETTPDSTAVPTYSRITRERPSSTGHCQPFNFGSHSAPIARREPEERIPSSSLGEEETWICDHCTMKNNRFVNTCSICSKSRNMDKPLSPDVRWGKPCSRCTLINKPELNFCEACDNKLPNIS